MNTKYICEFNFFHIYKNNRYKVSDEYAVISISKNACSTVNVQSYVYQNKIDINNFKDAEYQHLSATNFYYIFQDPNRKYMIKEKDNSLLYVCIIRDPIERLLSAYETKLFIIENSFDEFLSNVKYTFDNCMSHEINQHIHLQSAHFDFNDVDIFIYISDYEKFCNENNIPVIKLNQNPDKDYQSKIKLTDEHISTIKDLYKEDYEMIEKIKNSGKLFTSNNI